MDREHFYPLMRGNGNLDYEAYLNTHSLLGLQKDFSAFCNHDELQFQIVHQSEELWMKLIAYTLLDIDEYLQQENTPRVLSLFNRVHKVQKILIQSLDVLETMSPKEYQQIRVQLGNGSGQESPGFRTLLSMPKHLWNSFDTYYLKKNNQTIAQIYNSEYRHCNSYVIAESMIEFDELFKKFRYHHIQLIHRSIGLGARSLKGRSVELLETGLQASFFPQLWEIRNQMTNEWGGEYGQVRQPLTCPFKKDTHD